MNVKKLNLGMVKAERLRNAKQKIVAKQDAKTEECARKIAQEILNEINIENNIQIYRAYNMPTISEYVGNLKGIVPSTDSIWAPWSKSFK